MTRKADTHHFTNTALHRAYDYMCHLMRQGYEFPDACFKAANIAVPYEVLADFYDEMNADDA